MKKQKILKILITLTSLAFIAMVNAADHSEAPGTKADPAADIADLYAWHSGDKLNTILTFAGLQQPKDNQKGTYDKNVIYTINIDNDGDLIADIKIESRFKGKKGKTKIQVKNLPGTDRLTGSVDQILKKNGNQVFAGLVDDPFFFDFEGFGNTLATGAIAFDSKRDSFAGTNITAIVLQMDLRSVQGDGSGSLNIWATTSRKVKINGERELLQIDRIGMPAVATAVITSKDQYNQANPQQDAAGVFVNEIISNVTAIHNALDANLISLGITPCAVADCIAVAAPLIVPDVIKINTAAPAGFPNGRKLADPVMDVTLAVVLLDLSVHPVSFLADLPLNPPENDKFFSREFPFLADPHQAL